MARFFRKSIAQQANGSRALLDSQRLGFGSGGISGLIEVQAASQDLDILVFAGGKETGTYRLGRDAQKKIASSEVGTGWEKRDASIRTIALPDEASRAVWQILEFQPASRQEITGLSGWKEFLEACRAGGLHGMVEVASEACDGFILLDEGLPAPNESIFCTADGFTASLAEAERSLSGRSQVTVYQAEPAAPAYQCALLRVGASGWGSRILSTYQDMAGQKLMGTLAASLNSMFAHRQWNIRPVEAEIIDHHFFPESQAAAKAYQAMFGVMTQLIVQVIGGMVARRILNNTFEQLGAGQQQTLHTQALTPAAFLR
jgi:hypothetical protein